MDKLKKCSCCAKLKATSEYNKNKHRKDGLQTMCNGCSRKRSKKYYAENGSKHRKVMRARNRKIKKEMKDFCDAMKAYITCLVCCDDDPICLDFHHKDEKTKCFDISKGIANLVSWKRLKEEIAKCVVLCASCHRKLHGGRFCLIPSTRNWCRT